MITAYIHNGLSLERIELMPGDILPAKVIWVDMVEPTIAEEKFIETTLDIDLPTREEMDKIEVSNPFYKEKDAHYMTITILHKAQSDYPDSAAITAILKPQCVVTLRYIRPRAFTNFATRAMRAPTLYNTAELLFEGLLEALSHRIADALEKTGNDLDVLLKEVFDNPITNNATQRPHHQGSTAFYNEVIKKIGHTGNVISKNRESLQSINRMLIFYSQSEYFIQRENRHRFRVISREVLALTEYSNFLSTRNSFLLDATLGMLSVEQNSIIKVFTVAAAAFMPPTLIASVYGMNFHIPELGWEYGYYWALLLIVISAFAPYLYFKRKGWL